MTLLNLLLNNSEYVNKTLDLIITFGQILNGNTTAKFQIQVKTLNNSNVSNND